MNFLDLISVLVLLTGKTECVGHESEDACGHLKILNHNNLYYGGNVTLTFQPKKKSNERLELKNLKNVHFEHVNETSNETYTFVLLNCQRSLQYADFYVKYECTTGFVRLRFKGTRQDTSTNAFTTSTTIAKINQTVLKPSAANEGSQTLILVVVCAVLVLIIVVAVVVAVVCFKRKRRPVASMWWRQTNKCVEQVAQEEGYASIEGNECQYAVVNKPKKLSTPQANLVPPVENEQIEMLSQPKRLPGAGELIYADLDKEALTAKPSDAKPTGTLERPSTPTEYIGIDFARTVALENANKQDE